MYTQSAGGQNVFGEGERKQDEGRIQASAGGAHSRPAVGNYRLPPTRSAHHGTNCLQLHPGHTRTFCPPNHRFDHPHHRAGPWGRTTARHPGPPPRRDSTHHRRRRDCHRATGTQGTLPPPPRPRHQDYRPPGPLPPRPRHRIPLLRTLNHRPRASHHPRSLTSDLPASLAPPPFPRRVVSTRGRCRAPCGERPAPIRVIVLTLDGELMIIPTDAARYRIPKTSDHPGVRREPGINRGSSRPEPYAMITCFPEREHTSGACH